MNNVIEYFQEEHKLIHDTLDELLKVKSGCLAQPALLNKLESLILSHVSKEDVEIYAPFKKIASLNLEANKFLEQSHQNLESVKINAIIFFEKFKGERNENLCKTFHRDLTRLAEKINNRIELEDRELFPFLTNFWRKF